MYGWTDIIELRTEALNKRGIIINWTSLLSLPRVIRTVIDEIRRAWVAHGIPIGWPWDASGCRTAFYVCFFADKAQHELVVVDDFTLVTRKKKKPKCNQRRQRFTPSMQEVGVTPFRARQ